jgi:hypothetical protein
VSFGYTAFPGRTLPVGTVEQEEGAEVFPYQTVNIKTGRRSLGCSFKTSPAECKQFYNLIFFKVMILGSALVRAVRIYR